MKLLQQKIANTFMYQARIKTWYNVRGNAHELIWENIRTPVFNKICNQIKNQIRNTLND